MFLVCCFFLVEKLTVGGNVLHLKEKNISSFFWFSLYRCDNIKNCHLILRHSGAQNSVQTLTNILILSSENVNDGLSECFRPVTGIFLKPLFFIY